MPGFTGIRDLVDAELNGASNYVSWRKQATQNTVAGIWFDLSSSPGNPLPQYYAAAPLVSQTMSRSSDYGFLNSCTQTVSPNVRVLKRLMAMTVSATPLPMPMILGDYLMFYPFIDQSITDPQILTNIQSLSRYPTGVGVQVMAVVQGAQTGGQTFQFTYTNSAGVSGQVSQTVNMTASQTVNGTILTSDKAVVGCGGPFIGLQAGDSGVQSIQSVQCNGPDFGLFALVLVKPLAQMSIRGIDAPVELDFVKDFPVMPVIRDDAYLNFLVCPNGSLNAVPIFGDMTVVWN